MDTEEPKDYYEIFGRTPYESLYSSDDEEYREFRTKIMFSPHEKYSKLDLPFEGVRLMPYTDYAIEQTVKRMRQCGKRIFRILDEKIGVCAYGEYLPFSRNFMLLKYSHVHITDYTKELCKRDPKACRITGMKTKCTKSL